MAKATKQTKHVSRRRPVDLAAAPLTVSPPELGAPQLGQINRLGVARRVHHLDAASLPGVAPDIGPAEDHAAPQPAAPRAPKLPTGPQSIHLERTLRELYPDFPRLPTEVEERKRVIARKIERHLKSDCPSRKTIYRYIDALRATA